MSAKTVLLPPTLLTTETDVRQWLALAPAFCFMTRNQYAAILTRALPMLPIQLALSYRTPKGYLYLDVVAPNGALVSTSVLNNRAQWTVKGP